MAKAFLDAVGASSGPLYASAFKAAGAAVSDRLNLDAAAASAWIEGMYAGIRSRGGRRSRRSSRGGAGRRAGGTRPHRRDREPPRAVEEARRRSIGHVDPGAASAHVILSAIAEAAPKDADAGVA